MRLFFASVFLSKTLSLSLGSNACHRKNGWAFKRWATKPPGAPRSSHVSKDIKSTRWRNMKCNDAAGKGERRRATRWCTMCRVHGIDLHPSATPSVFPNRGFLCGFSARAADAYRPLQLFGRANLDSSSSRSQRASSIHEIPPPFALLPLLLPISEEEKETAKSRRAIVTSDDFARKSEPM